MNTENELDKKMREIYHIAGKETGYWGNYFLRSVKKNGGLKTAKRILSKRLNNPSQMKGFQTLLDAGRLDLSIEHLVLQPQFRELFTSHELNEAERRLNFVPQYAKRKTVPINKIYPDEITEEKEYEEGAKKRITINAYERDLSARKDCLKKYGYHCQVCNMKFEQVYGDIGKGFIHVHHKKPLAGMRSDYKVKPTTDLVPVCPNCHAMLHTSNPPLGIEELEKRLVKH